ncbi:excisionase, partial [Escherichia coli]|nr:excisionase [Escherichia coli]
MYLTLQEWNARQRRPRSLETVRRWVRECRIFPPPVKDGREYLFHESAVKVDLNRPVTGSLLKRIRNGCHERCNSDPHPTPEIRSR